MNVTMQPSWRYVPKNKWVDLTYATTPVKFDRQALPQALQSENMVVIVDGHLVHHDCPLTGSAQTSLHHAWRQQETYWLQDLPANCHSFICDKDTTLVELYTDQAKAVPIHLRIEVPENTRVKVQHCVLSEQVQTTQAIVHIDIHLQPYASLHVAHFHQHAIRRCGFLTAVLQEHACLESQSLFCSGAMARDMVWYELQGNNQIEHNHLQISSSDDYVEQRVMMNHIGSKIQTKHESQSVLAGSARSVIESHAAIQKGAQDCDVTQGLHFRLLSQQAQAVSRPVIQVGTDHVKAAHGSTIGQFEGDALRYIQSRGLSHQEARIMQVRAFVAQQLKRWAELSSGYYRNSAEKQMTQMLGNQYAT